MTEARSETLAIRGGRVIDPATGRDEVGDVLISDGRIVDALPDGPDRTIDAAGLVVCPGFVEPHAIAPPAGVDARFARQALAGGYTTVAAFGTTRRARDYAGPCPRLLSIGRLTAPGTRRLAELGDAAEAGAVGFGDGPEPHGDAELLRRGLLYAKMLGKPVFDLPRDPALSEGGVAHEGRVAAEQGLFGIPDYSETTAVTRGIELVRATGGRLHFTGLSTAAAAESIRQARREGSGHEGTTPRIGASVSAAHLFCTDEALRGFDPGGRVDPPFRTEEDRRALIRAATEGDDPGPIAALTSGHRPDPGLLDPVDLLAAPPGYEAFETAFAAANAAVPPERLSRLLALMSIGPARTMRLGDPALEAGARADLVLLDPHEQRLCVPDELVVPVARTPLAGRLLRGRVTHTLLGGRVVFERGAFPAEPAG